MTLNERVAQFEAALAELNATMAEVEEQQRRCRELLAKWEREEAERGS